MLSFAPVERLSIPTIPFSGKSRKRPHASAKAGGTCNQVLPLEHYNTLNPSSHIRARTKSCFELRGGELSQHRKTEELL